MEEKHCDTCMHASLPSGIEPCCNCTCHNEWKPKVVEPAVGIDPGAPVSDTTNVRIDWGESGAEMIGPKVGIDDDERGPVLAVTRMPLEMVIAYAIEGVKDRASKIGLKLTDKTMSEHDLDNAIGELRCLHNAWFDLEVERAEIQKAVEHVNDRDA